MKHFIFCIRIFGFLICLFAGDCFAQQQEWGPWEQIPCWPGLYASVRRGLYYSDQQKYEWYLKFQNTYNVDICFGFQLLDHNQENLRLSGGLKPDSRDCWKANETKGAGWYTTLAEADKVFIAVDDMVFGTLGGGSPDQDGNIPAGSYAPCHSLTNASPSNQKIGNQGQSNLTQQSANQTNQQSQIDQQKQLQEQQQLQEQERQKELAAAKRKQESLDSLENPV